MHMVRGTTDRNKMVSTERALLCPKAHQSLYINNQTTVNPLITLDGLCKEYDEDFETVPNHFLKLIFR